MGGDKVAHEQENAHDNVLGDGHDVRAGHLEDLEALLGSGVEVDVVGADTCSNTDLEVLRLHKRYTSNQLPVCYEQEDIIRTFSIRSRVR